MFFHPFTPSLHDTRGGKMDKIYKRSILKNGRKNLKANKKKDKLEMENDLIMGTTLK